MATFDPPLINYATPPSAAARRAAGQVAMLAGVGAGFVLPYFLACYGLTSLVLTGVLDSYPVTTVQGVQLVAALVIMTALGSAVRARKRWFHAGVVCGALVSIVISLD